MGFHGSTVKQRPSHSPYRLELELVLVLDLWNLGWQPKAIWDLRKAPSIVPRGHVPLCMGCTRK
jgi:hypothetical protein